MKGFTLYIVVFVLLVALFCMVALISTEPSELGDSQIGHLSGNPDASIFKGGGPAACSRNNPLSRDPVEPASEPQSGSFAACVSPTSGEFGKPKPKARLAAGRRNDLNEDEKPVDPNDNFVYTDDIVE